MAERSRRRARSRSYVSGSRRLTRIAFLSSAGTGATTVGTISGVPIGTSGLSAGGITNWFTLRPADTVSPNAGFNVVIDLGLGQRAVINNTGGGTAAPVNTVAPSIITDGSPQDGETVTFDIGTWTDAETYRIRVVTADDSTVLLDWTTVTGDTTGSLSSGYVGENIILRVEATGPGGTTTEDSDPVGPIAGGPSVPAYMVGGSIDADGWQMTAAGALPTGPNIESPTFSVSRPGFDSSGGATSYTEQMYVTRRVRQPYPNQASLTTDKAACSDFIYAADAVAGMTNNSTLVSPKPIAKWMSLDRGVIGNSVTPEITAFHRDGIAYVEFRATDGTNTVTAGTATPVVLGASYDKNAVIGYRATLDVTSLTAGLITVHAKVWPRIGVTASVLDSADKSTRREFSARYYRKDTTLAASPYYVYVATSGGNDTTGAVSTNAATAEASPVATIAGALQRINAVVGPVDGCIIRFMAGTHTLTSPAAARTQSIAAVTLTRDPNASRASVILQMPAGAVNFSPKLSTGLNATTNTGCMRIEDVTFTRGTGTLAIAGDATKRVEVQMVNLSFDNNSAGRDMINLSDFWWHGVTLLNNNSSFSQSGNDGRHMMWRGCDGALGNTVLEGYCVVGCSFTSIGRVTNGDKATCNGSIVAFNKFTGITTTGTTFSVTSGTSELTEGAAFVQNLIEYTASGSYTGMTLSADAALPDTSHLLVLHNTMTGHTASGRSNLLYNETSGQARSHTLHRVAGNIHGQLNTKHDIFALDGTRVQGWSYLYGVGCVGEFTMFEDAGTFEQAYPGKNANIGISSTVRNDPLFTNFQGTIDGTTPGAGGGTYTLQAGSPAAGIIPSRLLPFDLAGTARPANDDSAGCYAA